MNEATIRLGVVLDDETQLGAARRDDPIDVVLLRSTFLNPPRASATRRLGERIREHHGDVEVIPYAWHVLTHEASDGVVVGANRSLGATRDPHGHLREGDAGEQAWIVTKNCAEALGASRVVLRTPPSFSPGSLSRRRFTNFVAKLGPEDPKLVWEPEGLWSAASASAFASPLGVEVLAPAFGMTGALLEFDGASWLVVSGSKDARMRSSHAEILAHELIDGPSLTVVFDGPRAYANVRVFARALEQV